MSVQLIDGHQRNKEHPDTFEIPSLEEISKLSKGDFVKIGYEELPKGVGERFWVILDEMSNANFYTGIVDNDLVLTDLHGKRYKDKVAFEGKHILQIL